MNDVCINIYVTVNSFYSLNRLQIEFTINSSNSFSLGEWVILPLQQVRYIYLIDRLSMIVLIERNNNVTLTFNKL